MGDKFSYIRELGLLALVCAFAVLTNMVGSGGGLLDSIIGMSILGGIGFVGVVVGQLLSRFVKLPSVMYVSLLGMLLASPISPVADFIIASTGKVAFMASATSVGALAGISMGKDIKTFAKMGWKYILITILVITSTFVFSALIAHFVMLVSGQI